MVVLDSALLVLVLALMVAIGRILAGPTDADRVVALDYGFVVFVAGIALLAVRLDTPALLDLVLAATLVGFLVTVAMARLAARR
jgi:multicomponent Na+:H+ antiporter subunit F